tara:strand:- start:18904 stop:19068 length:165 start_codon:yes stop_codon:yes gene_type:complete
MAKKKTIETKIDKVYKFTLLKRFPTKEKEYLAGDTIEVSNPKVISYLKTYKYIK